MNPGQMEFVLSRFEITTTVLVTAISYDLKMKTREQNRNNKRTEIERFDWFIEWVQTYVAFGWLSDALVKKLHARRTFYKSIETSL